MNIFIRADSSEIIGTGHIMRCLVLAEDLRTKNANVTFICRKLPGDLIKRIKDKSFTVLTLPSPRARNNDHNYENWLKKNWKTDVLQTMNAIGKHSEVDWLIIDHYSIDEKWEGAIKPFVKKIMVIDDLANRKHACDLLLDQNLFQNPEKRYYKLIPGDTTVLLGAKYLLLRREFRKMKAVQNKTGNVKRILISFGGSDPTNETMKTLKAIEMLNLSEVAIDIVIGISNQNYSAINKFCEKSANLKLHYQIDYLADLMVKADLAIGAGGSTTWERCYLGLPAITIETAENQSEILMYLSEIGAISHLGKSEEVSIDSIAGTLQHLMNHPGLLENMAKISKSIMSEYQDCLVAEQLLGAYDNG
ncbi:UDP-2,4-diacetamido-2,4,6-trideoxy-beta-L-altropyranose hydrolase [Virgibacillus flavescens]|uniref:UDP-2,4-diacetamido-2,4, 6-trideoxy-beta-L-altropyranose hydrolase n=1 Tax=Virgibacillus flavescens TaxID=1611422 RepID=UPI003D327F7C